MQNIKAIVEKCLIGRHYLTKPQPVINVSTIKKKYVDQIRDVNIRHGEKFFERQIIILGVVNYQIVFAENGRLYKIHQNDYVKILFEEIDITMEKAWQNIRQIPQLFAD